MQLVVMCAVQTNMILFVRVRILIQIFLNMLKIFNRIEHGYGYDFAYFFFA